MLLLICLGASGRGFNEGEKIIDKGVWYKPDLVKLQYAGNIGFMSVGVGFNWWRDIAETDIMYGYVPENNGDATIHTFTVKNTFNVYNLNVSRIVTLSPVLGFSVSFEPGQNSFIRLPEKYPKKYYGPNCFYACLNLGLKARFKLREEYRFSAIELYSELNTLADYSFYNIIAREDRENIIYSLAFGVNMFF